jgi:hypothetical protein
MVPKQLEGKQKKKENRACKYSSSLSTVYESCNQLSDDVPDLVGGMAKTGFNVNKQSKSPKRKLAPKLTKKTVPSQSPLHKQPVNFCLVKGVHSFNVPSVLSNSFLNQKARVTLSDKMSAAASKGPVLHAHFTIDYFSLHEAARFARHSLHRHSSTTKFSNICCSSEEGG